MGVFLYASGAQRQVISSLHSIGITCGYSTLVNLPPPEVNAPGLESVVEPIPPASALSDGAEAAEPNADAHSVGLTKAKAGEETAEGGEDVGEGEEVVVEKTSASGERKHEA